MKSTVWPILKREYLSRVRTKAFWISTALFPILIFAMTIVPSLLTARTKASPEPVLILDAIGDFAPVATSVVATEKAGPNDPKVEVVSVPGTNEEEIRSDYNARAEAGRIQGYYLITSEAVRSGKIVYWARNPGAIVADSHVNGIVSRSIRKYRLTRLGLSGQEIDDAIAPIDIDMKKATNDPSKAESGLSAFFMSFALVFFIYLTLIFYGIYVLRGVLEEKSNRIVEVIVSSVKPFHLMLGKIVGIGAVGLTQIAIWALSALLLTAPQLASALSISADQLPKVSAASLIFLPVYFVLGYFLYATIYAGIGSMFNSEEDAQQMLSVANIFLVVPMFMLMPVMKNPGGMMATVLSLIPFFTPTLMYLRIGVQMPPAWQIGLSIVIMLATIVLMIWLVAKIYRVGILMYGKKPTIPEILRWLRYT